jgi:hypothetical protein
METQWYEMAALGVVVLTAVYNLISSDWRKMVGAIAIQYVGIFVLVLNHLPFSLALIKLIEGWMAGAIVGATLSTLPDLKLLVNDNLYSGQKVENTLSVKIFRGLSALMMGVILYPGGRYLADIFSGLSPIQAIAGLSMLSIGLLIICFRPSVFAIFIGLLTSLGGFEVIYAALEPSLLINGLLSGVSLGLAIVISYLLVLRKELLT